MELLCGFPQADPEQEVLIPVPVSVQLLTLVALHVILDALPERTLAGAAPMVSTGLVTVIVTTVLPVPHWTPKSDVADGFTVTVPDEAPPAEKPIPLQLRPKGSDHVIITVPPEVTVVGVPVTVGFVGGYEPCP